MTARSLLTAMLVGAIVGFVRPARAEDVWSAPYAGVRMLHRTGHNLDVRVLLVDLARPEISLVVTAPRDRMITVSEFARRYEADVAINANFFDGSSCGLMAGAGDIDVDAYEDRCTASMGFGRENEAAVFDSTSIPRGPLPAGWMSEVVSGKPFLMRDGRALTNWVRPQHLYRPNPRTALGLSSDRRTLVILVADGRRPGVPGITGFQMVALLREMGASDAINLDGGGSTELVMDGRVRNRPSDLRERVVLSHLGIRVRPESTWTAAEIVGGGNDAQALAGNRASAWLDVRNVGRRTWIASNGHAPVLEADDGAIGYLASLAHNVAPGDVARFRIDWLARGDGLRHLRGRVLDPISGAQLDRATTWDLEVSSRDATTAPTRQRGLASARAREFDFPAGMGAVMFQARGCGIGPVRADARTRVGSTLTIAIVVVVARRRRTRPAA